MSFRNPLKYIPTVLIVGIYLGACGTPKDTNEVSDSIGSMDSSMADSTISISNSVGKLYNQISVQDSILISKLDSINYYLGDIHESLHRIHEKLDGVHTSLDSVASLP